jgi:hypothetical protein
MVPSSLFGLNWPIAADDIMAQRPGNPRARLGNWQFGLIAVQQHSGRRELRHAQTEPPYSTRWRDEFAPDLGKGRRREFGKIL